MSRIEAADDRFIWLEEALLAREIHEKFGQKTYPQYLRISEGILRSESTTVEPSEVLRIQGKLSHSCIEILLLGTEGHVSKPILFPVDCDKKVIVLPPHMRGEDHVYKSVRELIEERPAWVKVTKIRSHLNQALQIKQDCLLELVCTGDGLTTTADRPPAGLVCLCEGKHVTLPLDLKADFSVHVSTRLYTIKEVVSKYKSKKRILFVDDLSELPLSEEVKSTLIPDRYHGEAIVEGMFEQSVYVCTTEPTDTKSMFGRQQAIFLPLDQRGSQCCYQLPAGIVPTPSIKSQLSRGDMEKLLRRINGQFADQDQIVAEAADILEEYKEKAEEYSISRKTLLTTQEDLYDYYESKEEIEPEEPKPPILPRGCLTQRQTSVRHRQAPPPPGGRDTHRKDFVTPHAAIGRGAINPGRLLAAVQPAQKSCTESVTEKNPKSQVATRPFFPKANTSRLNDPVPQSVTLSDRPPYRPIVSATVETWSEESNNLSDGSTKATSSLGDIPRDLFNLPVTELCTCLRLLKLERVANTFEENLIDGEMLKYISEEAMATEPLCLSSFEILKLSRILKGWRPK